jgi:DNA-binding PadR family transcriptional regulator
MNDLIMLATFLGGPKHGYQIKREAGWIFGHEELHNNLVYPMLRQFTEKGWVTKKTVPGQRGQTRQQYAITASGRKELLARLREYSDGDSRSFSSFATRVAMFELLDLSDRERILDLREAFLREREQKLQIIRTKFELGTYAEEVVRYLVHQSRSELAWIRSLRRR